MTWRFSLSNSPVIARQRTSLTIAIFTYKTLADWLLSLTIDSKSQAWLVQHSTLKRPVSAKASCITVYHY